MATIEIKNLDRCLGKFKKTEEVELDKAVKKATAFVHGQAKALAPVDTGNLSGSIHMRFRIATKEPEGQVYTNLNYAPFVEFGTGIVGDGSYPYSLPDIKLEYRQDWVGMPAQPFLYPALKQSETYVKNVLLKELKAGLKKAIK